MAEEEIKTYFKIKEKDLIKLRRLELLVPYIEENDENVGGGRSNIKASTEERKAVILADDPVLKWYDSVLRCIDYEFNRLDDEKKEIIRTLYTEAQNTRYKRYNDKDVAILLNTSIDEVRNTRNDFIKLIANKKGYKS